MLLSCTQNLTVLGRGQVARPHEGAARSPPHPLSSFFLRREELAAQLGTSPRVLGRALPGCAGLCRAVPGSPAGAQLCQRWCEEVPVPATHETELPSNPSQSRERKGCVSRRATSVCLVDALTVSLRVDLTGAEGRVCLQMCSAPTPPVAGDTRGDHARAPGRRSSTEDQGPRPQPRRALRTAGLCSSE